MGISAEDVTGLVLAGGRATRMGGVDKGLQDFRGEPMAVHVLRRLRPQVGQLMINANRHLEDYARLGAAVCVDDLEGYAGPLAGIHAGLSRCTTAYLVSAPCDSPLLPMDLVACLAHSLEYAGADAALAVTGTAAQKHRHPVFMLVKASLASCLADYLAAGGRKVDAWLNSVRSVESRFDDETAFANINHMDDLAKVSALVDQPRSVR